MELDDIPVTPEMSLDQRLQKLEKTRNPAPPPHTRTGLSDASSIEVKFKLRDPTVTPCRTRVESPPEAIVPPWKEKDR